ncbi:MAG TPA: TonB-dependent receptor [Bryocella sp.]|nr:TonB-dependent receptor [Bryocella sp.]
MKRNLMLGRLGLLCSAFLLSASVGMAQSTTQGAIAGTVFDATGAAIPGAKVLIHNNATNAEDVLTTDASGFYKAPLLPPGTYTVTITAPGFTQTRATNVTTEVNVLTTFDQHLQTGAETQTVEVSATLPVLDFSSATYGGHLENKEIEDIPINNRRWSALALLTPAATPNSDGFGLISFHAISPLLNNVEIDGADDNQAFFSEERGRTRAGYSTSQAAVREFQVNSGTYSAEYGRAVGAVINSVTKQGGNKIHGEAYFYNRNSSRSAFGPGVTNTTFNAATGQYVTAPYRPKDNRNQFGFQIGGALIKDRLFWSYSFDMYRRNFPGTSKANVPGTFFTNGDAALPATTNCGSVNATSGTYTPAAANSSTGVTATPSQDQPVCLLAFRQAAAAHPTAAQTSVTAAQYAAAATLYNTQLQATLTDLGSVPRFGDQEINTPRLDYQLSDKEHVSLLYHRLRWDSPGGVQTQATNNYAVDTFGTDFVKLDYGVAELESQLTTHLTNEARFQYGRELNDEGQQPYSAYTKSNLVGSNGVVPEVSVNQSVGFYMGSPYYSYRQAYPDERKTQVGDTANFLFGRHSLRFGGDVVHNNDLQNNLYESNGFYSYSAASGSSSVNYFSDRFIAGGKTCPSSASGVATPTTGFFPCYSSFAQSFGQPILTVATTDYGFFAQDDWQFSPRLTLNLGVRYDFESLPAPFAPNSAVSQTTTTPSDKNNISPRIGMAWDPFGRGKTTVHLGYGLFYGRIFNALLLNALENTGAGVTGSSPTSQALYNYSSTTAGAPTLPGTATTLPPGGAIGPSIEYLDSHLQSPYTEQMTAAVQQDLGFSTIFSLSYFGALGRELPNYLNLDLNPASTYTINYTVTPAAGTTNCGPIACGTVVPAKVYANRKQTGTTAGTYDYSPLQNSAYNGITALVSNINSNYHAMTAELQRRGGKYATFDINYTWAHAMDFNQATATSFTAGNNNWFDPYADARANYANSLLNTPNRIVAWALLTAPGTHGDNWMSYLTNGWSINPLLQFQTGLPYSALVSGSAPNQCSTLGCLESNGSGLAGTGVTYIPLLGRNTRKYPSTVNNDLRLTKAFKIGERYNLQLLGEAFNVANHRNITGINTQAYTISSNVGTTAGATTASLVYGSSFGTVTAANSNASYQTRQIQIAAKLFF